MKKLLVTFGLVLLLTAIAYAAFDPFQQPSRTPHIGTIAITLQKTINPHEKNNVIDFIVTVDDQFENTMGYKSGNLVPHLTAGQITQLSAFMDAMWVKSENEILP